MPEVAVQQPVEGLGGAIDVHGAPPIPVLDKDELGVPTMDGLSAPVVDGDAMVPIVDRDGLGTGTTTNGLTPALPISTEPIGIPARAPPAGDADDVAADNEGLPLELVPQVPGDGALPGNDVSIPIPPPS